MGKPVIELIECDDGEWKVLRVDYGEAYRYAGHSMPDDAWISVLRLLGHEVQCSTVNEEDIESY